MEVPHCSFLTAPAVHRPPPPSSVSWDTSSNGKVSDCSACSIVTILEIMGPPRPASPPSIEELTIPVLPPYPYPSYTSLWLRGQDNSANEWPLVCYRYGWAVGPSEAKVPWPLALAAPPLAARKTVIRDNRFAVVARPAGCGRESCRESQLLPPGSMPGSSGLNRDLSGADSGAGLPQPRPRMPPP